MFSRIAPFLIMLVSWTYSQVVTWEPAQPWEGGSVTIYYDLDEGTLPDNSSQVLIHMGYNEWTNVNDFQMSFSGTGTLWEFVWTIPMDVTVIDFVFTDGQGNWDNNGGVGIDWHILVAPAGLWNPIVPNTNDTITITVSSNKSGNLWWGVNGWTQPLNSYWPPGTMIGEAGFSVESPLDGPDTNGEYFIQLGPFTAGNQPVEVLNFVFHWSDGSWDNNNGRDYHIVIDHSPGDSDATIDILSHNDNDVVDSTATVVFNTSGSTYTEVWINGLLAYSTNEDGTHSFIWDTEMIALGKHTLWFKAQNSSGRVTFKKLTVWKSPDIVEAPLPGGINLGVNITAEGGKVTFALLAPEKAFVTLLTSWEDWDPNALVMNYDQIQGTWWLEVSLSPGTYQYMYMLNGQKKIGDPYATDVQWKLNGNEDWRVENQVCQFTIGAAPFPWSDGDWYQLPMEDLIIYELLVRDFSPQKNFQGVIQNLDYMVELGINAIEFMPVWEFPGASSWGYNPTFFFAVESSYGAPNDFKALVNEAHARGIAVLLDVVFNHCDGTSPYYQLYERDFDNSPYIHAEQNPWGMPDFDHKREGTKRLVRDVVRYWMEEYHIDGFRYDNTTGFGWSGLNDYGISVFSYEAWLVNPDVYQIAEHFSGFNDLYNLMKYTKINSHWHDIFHDQMKANLREGSFEGATYGNLFDTAKGISYARHGFSKPRNVINYTESHDEQRVILEAQTNANIDYDSAVLKSKLGATVLFTSTGLPMLYHGQEFGMDTEKTLDVNPLQWSMLDSPVGMDLFNHYQRLIWLRNQTSALRGQDVNFFFSTANHVIAYDRSDSSGTVQVVANFSSQVRTLNIPFPHPGIWFEFILDDTIHVTESEYPLTIPGSQAYVYVDHRTWLGTETEIRPLPLDFSLSQNYPNPFNPETQFTYSIPEAGPVSLAVYDLMGREIIRLVDRVQGPGSHTIIWDGRDRMGQSTPSGMYIYRLTSVGRMDARKMLLLK